MDQAATTTTHKNKYLLLAILLLVLIILGVLAWLFIPRLTTSKNTAAVDSFFDSQNAVVSGKVTTIVDKIITIENKKGIKRSFSVSPAYTVMTTNEQGAITPSNDLSKVEIGKQYSLNLSLGVEGKLEITTIMSFTDMAVPSTGIVPPPPAVAASSPTVASRSASPTPRVEVETKNSEE